MQNVSLQPVFLFRLRFAQPPEGELPQRGKRSHSGVSPRGKVFFQSCFIVAQHLSTGEGIGGACCCKKQGSRFSGSLGVVDKLFVGVDAHIDPLRNVEIFGGKSTSFPCFVCGPMWAEGELLRSSKRSHSGVSVLLRCPKKSSGLR